MKLKQYLETTNLIIFCAITALFIITTFLVLKVTGTEIDFNPLGKRVAFSESRINPYISQLTTPALTMYGQVTKVNKNDIQVVPVTDINVDVKKLKPYTILINQDTILQDQTEITSPDLAKGVNKLSVSDLAVGDRVNILSDKDIRHITNQTIQAKSVTTNLSFGVYAQVIDINGNNIKVKYNPDPTQTSDGTIMDVITDATSKITRATSEGMKDIKLAEIKIADFVSIKSAKPIRNTGSAITASLITAQTLPVLGVTTKQ